MYLRFVVADIHKDSGRELGIFHAIGNLKDEGRLHAHEEELHDSIVQWFSEHLEKPTRFTASRPPFYRKKTSRFRGSKIRRMSTLLACASWPSSWSTMVFRSGC